jgi:hypothetical protein
MLDRSEEAAAQRPEVAECTVRACSLLRESVADFSRVHKLADRAVTGTEKHRLYRHFALAKGLAELRAGRDAAAIEWVQRYAPEAANAPQDGTGFLILAMANARLNHPDKAKAAMNTARAVLAQTPDQHARHPWIDWLHCEILLREAEDRANSGGVEAAPARRE